MRDVDPSNLAVWSAIAMWCVAVIAFVVWRITLIL